MGIYLVSMLIILVVLLVWVAVQQQARRFAQRHPELGPAREEGGGCGSACSCGDGEACGRKTVS